jgi:peptidoglycan/LPS O-acetylase OafA/YrhL
VPRSARGFAFALRSALPDEAERAAAADQASDRPTIVLFSSLEGPLHLALWAGALLVAARCVHRNRQAGAWLVAATMGFLALHALVVAFGTSPFGRYQGRVSWLIASALVIAAWTQRAGEAGGRSLGRTGCVSASTSDGNSVLHTR